MACRRDWESGTATCRTAWQREALTTCRRGLPRITRSHRAWLIGRSSRTASASKRRVRPRQRKAPRPLATAPPGRAPGTRCGWSLELRPGDRVYPLSKIVILSPSARAFGLRYGSNRFKPTVWQDAGRVRLAWERRTATLPEGKAASRQARERRAWHRVGGIPHAPGHDRRRHRHGRRVPGRPTPIRLRATDALTPPVSRHALGNK